MISRIAWTWHLWAVGTVHMHAIIGANAVIADATGHGERARASHPTVRSVVFVKKHTHAPQGIPGVLFSLFFSFLFFVFCFCFFLMYVRLLVG